MIAARAISQVPAAAALRSLLLIVAIVSPSLVALALTARTGGHKGIRELLGGILHWRAGAGWYVFAAGYFLGIKLFAALVHRLAVGAWPRFGEEAWYVIVLAIGVSMWFQAGEEIGWRAYALPRLAHRIGLAWASFLIGVVWAAWHLPGFFMPEFANYGQSFPLFIAGVIPMSVAMAWLYWRTNGSLLLTMLMHAAVNNTTGIVPSTTPSATDPMAVSTSLVAWLTVGLMWLTAACLLIQMRGATLPRLSEATRDRSVELATPVSS
jgi:membrane protease YdiL (CAAX protease family)